MTISVKFAEDGETIEEHRLRRARLRDLAGGDVDAHRARAGPHGDRGRPLPKEELLEEIGIPLTPIRLKCAILGLGVLKVALNKAKGTPLPEEWQGLPTTSPSG